MPDEQIEDNTATQINILSPEFQEPMDINLTRGQLLFIYQILERNIRPQGLDMIEFSYDLNDDDFYVSPQLEGSAKNTLGEEISIRISFADEILQGENNKKTSFITQSEFYSGFGIDGPFTINDFFGAVYTMDKAYRDYYKMQMLQDADNPFSEPVMFTNSFSGGAIGVFGSYDFVQGQFKYTP